MKRDLNSTISKWLRKLHTNLRKKLPKKPSLGEVLDKESNLRMIYIGEDFLINLIGLAQSFQKMKLFPYEEEKTNTMTIKIMKEGIDHPRKKSWTQIKFKHYSNGETKFKISNSKLSPMRLSLIQIHLFQTFSNKKYLKILLMKNYKKLHKILKLCLSIFNGESQDKQSKISRN